MAAPITPELFPLSIITHTTMKKPTQLKFPATPRTKSPGRGMRELRLTTNSKGAQTFIAKIEPHFTIVVTGGRKPTVSLLYSHHGITFDSFELNGKFEKVIDHIRAKFPELRVD